MAYIIKTGGTATKWLTIRDADWPTGVVVRSCGYVKLLRPHVQNPNGIGVDIREGAHHVAVIDGHIHNCGTDADDAYGGVAIRTCQGAEHDCQVRIQGNAIYRCEGAGVNAEGEIHDDGRFYYLKGVRIIDNSILAITQRPNEGPSNRRTGVGIQGTTIRTSQITGNYVSDCSMTCIHLDCGTREGLPPIGPSRYIHIEGNRCWNAGQQLIELEGAAYCRVLRNLLMGGAGLTHGYANAILLVTYAKKNQVAYNIVTNEMGGYTGPLVNIREQATANTIEHNTLVAIGQPSIVLGDDANDTAATKNTVIRSNILGYLRLECARGAGYVEDYNCFISTMPAVGHGAYDFEADPQFVDAAHYDYHLAPGSPCIGAGHGGNIGAL